MLARHRILQLLAYGVGALLVWALVGCGGSGSSSGAKVALTIAWPQRTSRYLPTYSNSLAFYLYNTDNENNPFTLIVNRPDTLPLVQTVEFSGPIPAGTYVLQGQARTGSNGFGDTVASATTNVDVPASGTTTVALSLNSTLYSIDLLDMPLTLNLGDAPVQLRVRVLDKNQTQIFLPNGALTWAVVFGSDAVSVTTDGQVTPLGLGQARVLVSEVGAGLYSEGDITVEPVAVPSKKKAMGARRR